MAARALDQKGLNLIASFEGFRDKPYNDVAGHATIGFGHLLHHGNVTAADKTKWGTITRARGLEILKADAHAREVAVNSLVKVPLTQDQFDALVSFVFNVGAGEDGFAGSTLLKLLNQKHYEQVPAQLLRWNKAGGHAVAGLTNRRIAEGKLFRGTHALPAKVAPLNPWKKYIYGDLDCSLALLKALAAVGKECNGRVYVRFGRRTFAEQSALWADFLRRGKRPPLVARPGSSRHETGLAADCQFVNKAGHMVNLGDGPGVRAAMKRHGLCLPVPGETWHAERGTLWRA